MADTLRQTLRELAEDFRGKLNRSSYSPDVIPTVQIIEKQLIKYRATSIRNLVVPENQYKIVKPVKMNQFWAITVHRKRSSSEQYTFGNLKYTFKRFEIPPVISINTNIDGFFSVGSPKFSKIYTRLPGAFEEFQRIAMSGRCTNQTLWWYADGGICITDKDVEYIYVRGVPEDPTEWETWDDTSSAYVPAYDPDNDSFLVTSDVIHEMETLFKQDYPYFFGIIDSNIDGKTETLINNK